MNMYYAQFNMDTGWVDAWLTDGMIVSIDCTAVERVEADTNSILKTFNNPFATCNTLHHFVSQAADCFAQSVNDIGKRIEHLISESHRAELFPDLFEGIHFGRIRGDGQQSDITGTD